MRRSLRTTLLLTRDPLQQSTDFGLAVTTVSPKRPDRRQLSGLCPPSDGLRVDTEHRGDLRRREQRLSVGRACCHLRPPPRHRTRKLARQDESCLLCPDVRNGPTGPSYKRTGDYERH